MKAFIRTYFIELVVLFFISLLPLFWLRGGEVVLGHDANYHINHLERMISSTFSWNDKSYYGNDWTYDRGYFPVNLVQLLLLKVTPTYSAMQSLFFVFLFLLLGGSVYALTVGVFPEKRYRAFRLISAVFAIFNFFILQGWFTADTGRFLIFSGLPLYILVIHKLFTRDWSPIKSYLLFAVLSFFFNGNGLPPLVGFQAITIGLVGLFYAIFYVKKHHWSGVWFSLGSAIMFLGIFTLVNAYWILPIINFTSVSYTSSVATSGGIEGTLAWEQMISKFASFINLFRLQGIADWYDNPVHAYSHPYISDPFFIVLSFIPILTVITGLLIHTVNHLEFRKQRLLLLLLAVFITGLFMSSGTHPPFGKIYELFMRYIPGFVIFRSSLYKFGFALWIPMILLSGYFANEFMQRIKSERFKTVLLGIILLGIIGYHYPYFYPDKIFHFTDVFKTRFKLPGYVTDMLTYIDSRVPTSSRILLLPELDSEYIGIPVDAYDWGFYSIVMLPNFISNRTYIADNEGDNVIQMIYRSIYSGDVATFERITRKAGISYILFRQDVQLSPGALKQHPIAEVEKRLISLPTVRLEREFGNWRLYAILSSKDASMISSLQSYDMILPPTTNSTYLMAKDTDDSHGVIQIFSEDTKSFLERSAMKQIIEAECYLCKKDEYQMLVKGITLPGKKPLPSFITDIVSARQERLNLLKTLDRPKERIDVDLSLAQDNLAAGTRMIGNYKQHIQDLIINFGRLSGRDQNLYAIRIKAYLESQLFVVSKYKELSETADFLSSEIETVKRVAWYTDDTAYLRFGFTITAPGMYEFYIPDMHLYANQIVLDNKRISSSEPEFLQEGYHRVELHRINPDVSIFNGPPALFIEQTINNTKLQMPKLTYTRINPTQYTIHVSGAVEPFILEFNQKYDPRWKVYIKNSQLEDKNHVEINGFANGWYISQTGDFDIELLYWPQRIFYMGLVISGISIVIIIFAAGISLKRKLYEKN